MEILEIPKNNAVDYQRIVRLSVDLICIAGMDGYFKYVNSAWENILGYTRDELLARPFIDFIHPDDHAKNGEVVEKLSTDYQEAIDFENRYLHKDGSIRHISWTAALVDDEKKMYCIGRNITKHKLVQQRLIESEERFSKAFYGHQTPMQIVDVVTGERIDCNDGYHRLLGCEKDEITQENIYSNSFWENPEEQKRAVEKLIKDRFLSNYPVDISVKSGETRNLLANASMLDIKGENLAIASYIDITELKYAEEKLKASEARYRRIFETATEGIWTMDKDHRTMFVNEHMLNMLGHQAEDMIGKRVEDFIFVEDLSAHQERMVELHKKMSGSYEHRFRRSDGTTLWTLVSATVLTDENGDFDGSFGMFTNITDRKKAEDALRASETRFSTIFHTSPLAIALTSLEGNQLVEVNPAWQEITGYTFNEAIGKTANDLNLYVSSEKRSQMISEVQKHGKVKDFEFQLRNKSGEVIDLLFSAELIELAGKRYILSMALNNTERKKAEETLMESEAELLAIYNDSPLIMLLVDDDRRVLKANRLAIETAGRQGNEIEGLRGGEALKCIHAFDDPVGCGFGVECEKCFIRNTVLDTIKTGIGHHNVEAPVQLDLGDGVMDLFFLVSTSPLHVAGTKRTLVCLEDITERKQAEQERVANIHFLDSMDRINRAMQQRTDNLEQEMSNVLDEVISIFNCDRAFLIHCSGLDLGSWTMPIARWRPEYPISYSNKPIPLDSLGQKVVKAMIDTTEPVKAGPGTPFPLTEYVSESFGFKSFMGTALYPNTGDLWVLGIHQCSHERIFTTEEERLFKEIAIRLKDALTSLLMYRTLSESEEKYRSMMESMSDPVYICSHEFNVEYMNPAMIQRVGRDAVGEKCYSALHDLNNKCEWCIYKKNKLDKPIETNIVSPKDNKTYRVTNIPIQNKDGSMSKMTIFRDITDFVKAVEEKKKAEGQLLQAQKMESIGTLAGGIAHDFNNILSAILGFTELAISNAKSDTLLIEDLNEVYLAGIRAKELVQQILAFARQTEEETQPIQIDIIVREVLKLIRASTPATIEIKQDINSDSIIMGNTTRIHQIIMNLCTNAIYAMDESGGVLDVALKDVKIGKSSPISSTEINPGDYIEICVSDSGTGIAPNAINSIFDPYYTTKTQGEGTGLGLSLVHGIVKKSCGKVTVESQLGKGTTISVYLPITKKRQNQQPHESEDLPRGEERILLVDDEAAIVKLSGRILEGLGYRVTTRTSSIEALELFRSKPNEFDAIITDMTMPNMAGDALATELMKIRLDIPIILCTGYSKKMSVESASVIGIKAFVYKPVVKTDLARTVRKVLDDGK